MQNLGREQLQTKILHILKPGQGEAGALVINESVEMRELGRGRSWAVDAQGRPKVTISVQVKPRPTWEGFPAPSALREACVPLLQVSLPGDDFRPSQAKTNLGGVPGPLREACVPLLQVLVSGDDFPGMTWCEGGEGVGAPVTPFAQ